MGPKNNILEGREYIMRKLVKSNTSRKDSVEAYACYCHCACYCNSSPKVDESVTKNVKSMNAPSTK